MNTYSSWPVKVGIILCGMMRLVCEFGFPIILFFVVPTVWAISFLILFVAWQLFSLFVLSPLAKKHNKDLEETKEHIHSVVRRYKTRYKRGAVSYANGAPTVVNEDASFLFAFIQNWDEHLNPLLYDTKASNIDKLPNL